MQEKVSALLVYGQDEPLGALDLELRHQFIKTCRAETCQEAAHLLDRADPPHLVFTDTTLPDGTWEDVLNIATRTGEPLNVIVVARFADIKLDCEAMQMGASDFIVPPFFAPDLTHVVACAMEEVASRPGCNAHAA